MDPAELGHDAQEPGRSVEEWLRKAAAVANSSAP